MASPRQFDLVLRGADVVDGTGVARFRADVGICADRIAAVGEIGQGRATEELDVGGLVVAPGFIDVHTHDDRMVLAAPENLPKITQGVTTVVTGNCGISLAPLVFQGAVPEPLNLLAPAANAFFRSFEEYVAAIEQKSPAVNVVPLVGHMTLRTSFVSRPDAPATDAEVRTMSEALRKSLQAGAFGFSSGLAYPLSRDASTLEVISLAKVAGEMGGIYTTHLRDESDGILQAIAESLLTAREAGVRLIMSHHKCSGISAWGRSVESLAALDDAAKEVDFGFDAYPYTASSTVLSAGKVRRAKQTMVTWSDPFPEMSGRALEEIARAWSCTQEEACRRLAPAGAIYFNMDEADVQRILKHPRCMIGSDGLPHDKHPHPRLWGTFPRVLGHYVRKLGLYSLEEGVHRMTGLTASRLGLQDRGAVRQDAFADLCVFDPNSIEDLADFTHPTRPAAGIRYVIVNGSVVVRQGQLTGRHAGRLLTRSGRNPA
jgi:N-acyl-D-amino-acid deacylase